MKSHCTVAVVAVVVGLVSLWQRQESGRVSFIGTADGCWDTDNDWAIDTSGNGAMPWVPNDDANFYANSAATSPSRTRWVRETSRSTGSGYTISGGSLNVTGTITTNQNATINSVLVGSNGLTTAGTAILTLGGANTYTRQDRHHGRHLGRPSCPPLRPFTPLNNSIRGKTVRTPAATAHGDISGTYTITTGKYGQALGLPGAKAIYIEAPYSSSFAVNGAYTISCWVNISATNSGGSLISAQIITASISTVTSGGTAQHPVPSRNPQ